MRRQVHPFSFRADVVPSSLNEEKRTIDIVWTTGARVRRGGFWSDPYNEELKVDQKSVRLDRLNASAPLLNSHSSYDLSNVIGVVERAWIENGKGHATVRFSQRDDVKSIYQDVKDGILKNISVGYRIHKVEDITQSDDKIKTVRAIDWEPYELSIVPIPADAGAQVRSGINLEPNDVEIINYTERGSNMKPNETQPDLNTAPVATSSPAELEAARKLAVEEERKRVSDITAMVTSHRLGNDFQSHLISKGYDVDQCRKLILDELTKRQPVIESHVRVEVTREESVTRQQGIEEAILHRHDGKNALTEKGREYRNLSLYEMGKECLEARGIKTRGLSKMELASLMLEARGGLHSTSDFPLILANVINKTLRAGYQAAPRTFMPFVRVSQISDFKEVSRTQLGDAPKLSLVGEHGEFQRGSVAEGAEKYKLKSYGKIIGLTRQVIINDDLGAFTRIPEMFGRSAADLESEIVYGILNDNAALSDSIALFHASHSNLGTGARVTTTALSEAREAMRLQKGLSAESLEAMFINIMAKYLIVAPEYETEAEQILSSTMIPNQSSNVSVFANKLQLIVEPRISLNTTYPWFVAADPSQVDTIEVGYLQGQEGVFIEMKEGFEVDGLEIKARHDFAAKAIDYRGLFKNPGLA